MYTIQPLQKNDYYNGFLQLLSTLTVLDADSISYDDFCKQYDKLKNKVFVIKDEESNMVVATASIIIEAKFIRNLSSVGHIEDVVVSPAMRGSGLGKLLIDYLKGVAKDEGCYKVILDCSAENVVFYEKCGFVKKGVEMGIYFDNPV